MKIDDSMKKAASTSTTDVKQRQTANTGAAKAGGSARSHATSGSGSTDPAVNVSLSSQLQSVMEQVGDTAVFDAKKVDEIKAAISGGNFQIDTEKVADGLLKTVSDLLQKPRE